MPDSRKIPSWVASLVRSRLPRASCALWLRSPNNSARMEFPKAAGARKNSGAFFRVAAKGCSRNAPRISWMPAHKSSESPRHAGAGMSPQPKAEDRCPPPAHACRQLEVPISPEPASLPRPSRSVESNREKAGTVLARLLPQSACESSTQKDFRPPRRAMRLAPGGEQLALQNILGHQRREVDNSTQPHPKTCWRIRLARFGLPEPGCHRRRRRSHRILRRTRPRPGPRAQRRSPAHRTSLLPVRYSPVLISMPGLHSTWQVRQYGLPSIAARHSKQIPIPHNGPRNSPLTDFRQAAPASAIATATVAPDGTTTAAPFTVSSICSDIDVLQGCADR